MGLAQSRICFEVCRQIFKEYAISKGYADVDILAIDSKLCWFLVDSDGNTYTENKIDVTTVPMETDNDGFVFVEALQTKFALTAIREYLVNQCKVSFT